MDFNKIELETLNHWDSINLKNRIKTSRLTCQKFNFLDGPPFVNGKPHHGHLLVSYIKDCFARYYSSLGYQLNYQIGFDCHGLPLEQEAEKIVGKVSSSDDITRVKQFNETCRQIISNCSDVWFHTLNRIGRQFDRDLTYYTSNKNYMESLWWGFKELFNKGLIYQSKKVMPYSPQLETPLSNFEANQNYQEITDISIYVKFKLNEKIFDFENVNMIVWTTTPWSLIANQGLCVNKDIEYNLVKSREQLFICAQNVVKNLFKECEILQTFLGSQLVGMTYQPILHMNQNPMGFKIYQDDYVKATTGTGIVHLAPIFGDDDMRVLNLHGYQISYLPNIIDSFVKIKDDMIFDSVNVKNMFIMDISPTIIQYLKNLNVLFKTEKIKHSYPFCWRTDKPLIYLAVDAWFLNVQAIKEQLLENNKMINWYPDYVGKLRFDNWIKEAPDWCLSRNRVWGTPIPIWISESGKMICIGSIQELEHLTNQTFSDIHIDSLYFTTITIDGEIYKRTPSVLDCWFESGMAGLSSLGYPQCVSSSYPVDFITESLDQTRGWFYTLNVLSTALNNKPAFKNVVVSGLILAEDGKKMSKRLQNYTAPNELIEKYGSDFIRMYLIGSPASHAESLCFKDEDIKEITKKCIPYINAFNMYSECLTFYNQQFSSIDLNTKSNNILDVWLVNLTHKLACDIKHRMNSLEIYAIPNIIYNYWEHITNDYIKLSRDRLKNQDGQMEAQQAISTLYYALSKSIKIISPFMPFITEYLYNKLNHNGSSVHLDFYNYDETFDTNIISAFRNFNNIVEAVRQLRHTHSVQRLIPLNTMELYLNDYVDENNGLAIFSKVLLKELNILNITFHNMDSLDKTFKPVNSIIGKTFKNEASNIKRLIESGDLSDSRITSDMYTFSYTPKTCSKDKMGVFVSESFHIYLDTELYPQIIKMAEIDSIRRLINMERKEMGLKMFNKIKIQFLKNDFWNSLEYEFTERIQKQLLADIEFVDSIDKFKVIETLFNTQIQFNIVVI